jgi:hypothetical protein
MVDKNTPIFFAAVLKALKGDLKELGRLWFSAKSRGIFPERRKFNSGEEYILLC